MKLPQFQQKTVITMFRALACAVLIALIAIANGVSPDLAANLSIIVCGTIWLTWPVLRRLPRLAKAILSTSGWDGPRSDDLVWTP